MPYRCSVGLLYLWWVWLLCIATTLVVRLPTSFHLQRLANTMHWQTSEIIISHCCHESHFLGHSHCLKTLGINRHVWNYWDWDVYILPTIRVALNVQWVRWGFFSNDSFYSYRAMSMVEHQWPIVGERVLPSLYTWLANYFVPIIRELLRCAENGWRHKCEHLPGHTICLSYNPVKRFCACYRHFEFINQFL